jgi:hypothetical protein
MFNPFVLKKYGALLMVGLITTICFFVGLTIYNFVFALGFMFAGLLLSVAISNFLLKTPFSDMLEGKGILVFKLDSTGILAPFIIKVDPPFIRGKVGKKKITDVFNRSTVLNLSNPINNDSTAKFTEDGKLSFTLDVDKYNQARFGFNQYPCLIYNSQLGTFLTKDFLSSFEKDTFAEHTVLYLNRLVEELTSVMRDFGRYVVESLNPKESWIKNNWGWLIIGAIVLILGILLAPFIIQWIQGSGAGAVGAVKETVSSAAGAIQTAR